MKTVVDLFNSQTGWAGSVAGVTVHAENEHEEYIANYQSKSLIFHFSAGSQNQYISKNLSSPFDVSDYDEIVVSLYSFRKNSDQYKTSSDFQYIIDFGTGKQYHIPAWSTFTQISIDISSLTSIERVRIIAKHNDEDYLVVSYMVAVYDEIPRDIFSAFKEGLELVRSEKYPYGGRLAATLTASSGDNSVTFTGNRDWISTNAVVLIRDGVNSEIHQIYKGSGDTFTLTKLYDGQSILNDYTDADVYLYFPIEFGVYAKEALFPGISIWGFVPTPNRKTPVTDETIKGFSNNNFQFKKGGMNEAWRIIIDAEAKDPENIADMTSIIRKYLSRCVAWINGRDFDFEWTEVPVDEEPTDAMEIIPKINYVIDIEIVEDVQSNISRVEAQAADLTLTIEDQGDIP